MTYQSTIYSLILPLLFLLQINYHCSTQSIKLANFLSPLTYNCKISRGIKARKINHNDLSPDITGSQCYVITCSLWNIIIMKCVYITMCVILLHVMSAGRFTYGSLVILNLMFKYVISHCVFHNVIKREMSLNLIMYYQVLQNFSRPLAVQHFLKQVS